LHDGSMIELREVRDDDKEAIAAGFARLSPESRYRRFFSAVDRLSAADLRYLTEVDHHDHEAVIAFDEAGGTVGVARYVRGEDASAEVAVVVGDEWQGNGVGTALLERLTERAAENGIERFVALVMQDNDDAIELFRSISGEQSVPPKTPEGYLELVIDVPAGQVRGTALGRALRSAAAGRVVIHPWRLIRERLQGVQRPTAGSEPESGPSPEE
jgi:GNAT superfamily N-acetyltransferase